MYWLLLDAVVIILAVVSFVFIGRWHAGRLEYSLETKISAGNPLLANDTQQATKKRLVSLELSDQKRKEA